jgi:DNA-binding transcriptional ArsR family regulator
MKSTSAAAKSTGVKCTSAECSHIKKKANSLRPILNDPGAIERRARVFQALGNATRIRILGFLWIQEMCLCNIVEAVSGAPSTVTHHLRMLENAGWISTRREGKFTIYSANAEELIKYRIFDEQLTPVS